MFEYRYVYSILAMAIVIATYKWGDSPLPSYYTELSIAFVAVIFYLGYLADRERHSP